MSAITMRATKKKDCIDELLGDVLGLLDRYEADNEALQNIIVGQEAEIAKMQAEIERLESLLASHTSVWNNSEFFDKLKKWRVLTYESL